MILEASQAGSRDGANFQQEIMRAPKIILLRSGDVTLEKLCDIIPYK